jgi:hypothetical protein
MIIRVPLLLQRSVAVIHRLDIRATRDEDPPGEEREGYDPILRETIAYERVLGRREDTRQELAPCRIPCQIELATEERLNELGVGSDSVTNMIIVFHRKDLERLSLLDTNREVVIKKGDRIDSLERYGAPVGTRTKVFRNPGLFVWEMRGASWGFGPDGYDLELAITSHRRQGPRT